MMKLYRVTQIIHKTYSLSLEAPSGEAALDVFQQLLKSDPEALAPDTVDLELSVESEDSFMEDTPDDDDEDDD